MFECRKPWQALDGTIAFIGIPAIPTYKTESMYTFDQQRFIRTKDAVQMPQRLLLTPPVPVEQGIAYAVRADIDITKDLPAEKRDGFIRMDFYEHEEPTLSKGMYATLSSRLFGPSGNHVKETVAMAPPGARFLVVSFQYNHRDVDFSINSVHISRVIDPVPESVRQATQAKEVDNLVVYPQFIF